MARSMVDVLSRAFFWTAGAIDGTIDSISSALRWKPLRRRDMLDGSAVPLRAAILGRHRRQIVEVLGAPPAVWAPDEARPDDYWHALTWYYPCDASRRAAMAIRFVNDRARRVEFIQSPG